MSGPDINRPRGGSNAIGQFVIGVSPIGTIPPFDLWETIISQFANSDRITGLIEDWFQCLDITANLDQFYDLMFNVTTAQGYGLNVWGKIVGVSRTLQISDPGDYFGYKEALPTSAGFNQAPFFSGNALTNNFDLTDSAYRTLIYAKALANITDGSIPSINHILMLLFPGRGNCYCTDGLDMTMTYTFMFTLTPVELAIIGQSGALPKPTGVSFTILQI